MEEEKLLKEYIEKEWSLKLNDQMGLEELVNLLATRINELIRNDFQQLISLLYRVDVSEKQTRQVLELNKDKDAAELIARLFINRQIQKIETRKQFSQKPVDDEEEKW